MPRDRFLISHVKTGLQTNLRPFLIMDDAWEISENMYTFRERMRKRPGSQMMGTLGPIGSRLRVQVGTYGSPSTGVPGNVFVPGQMFSIGFDLFTVYQTGTPAALLSTNANASGTYNTSNGHFSITYSSGAPGGSTPIYFYPSTPCMGITQYSIGVPNTQPTYAFDTQFAYLYSGGAWNRSGSGTSPLWHGTDLNFFDVCNWQGVTPNLVTMYVTNFNATVPTPAASDDPIWYTSDGATWTAVTGANGFYFAPAGGAPQTGPFIQTCRLIFNFKGRLCLFNTIEQSAGGVNAQYKARVRYCFAGSPLAVNAWYEPNQVDSAGNAGAGGGFLDAPTQEEIIGGEFIKDRLIIAFTNSTYELADTGNDILPFVWNKINTELGCEAQQSTVPFDKEFLMIGSTGVHACNGANVARIDEKIPDEIFDLKDANDGVQRICGIRDYFTEMVYWAFPANFTLVADVYPTRILAYNYRNQSWAIFDDTITAFGYWQQTDQLTWATWNQQTWQQSLFTWDSGTTQENYRQVLAGNQEGFMFVIDPDTPRNAPALQITNISITNNVATITAYNHNQTFGNFVLIENVVGINNINGTIYRIHTVVDLNNFTIDVAPTVTGTYLGGGTIALVSVPYLQSKQWNPYDKIGANVFVAKIDFLVTNSITGQVTVDYGVSSSGGVAVVLDQVPGVALSNNILSTGPYPNVTREITQERLWHYMTFQADGECIQIRIYLTDAQMVVPEYSLVDFELHAILLHTSQVGIRFE